MDYIKYALSDSCQPEEFNPGEFDESVLDRSVLDPSCIPDPVFLTSTTEFLDPSHQVDAESQFLLSTLKSALSNHSSAKFILSLSGGVDSMSLLLLLLKLDIPIIAVHIRHSSRIEDTKKELDWVRFVCKHFNVRLFHHHVQVARPHSTAGEFSAISRDQFEEYTRQVRFSMYEKASQIAFKCKASVLIGHHLDDVDENRIAELGKGNLINIDGMGEEDGNDVYRPLCAMARKADIIQFARKMQIPHMKNSTPKWSKRGWIRDVLDYSDNNDSLLRQLEALGAVSREIDSQLDQIAASWIQAGGIDNNVQMELESKTKWFHLRASVINTGPLDSLIATRGVLDKVTKMAEMSTDFGSSWNETVASFCALPDRVGVSCPIQPIRSTSNQDDFTAIVYTHIFQKTFDHIRSILKIERYISRKSVSQLVDFLRQDRVWMNWKLNNRVGEVAIIRKDDAIVVPKENDVDLVVNTEFGGNKESFKKTIVGNIHRLVISK